MRLLRTLPLLLALFAPAIILQAQAPPKQALNDELFAAARAGDVAAVRAALDRGGAFTASPVTSDGKIYLSSEDGEIFVFKAGPKHELLATNQIGEVMMATPAISEGMLIVRGLKHLYGLGEAAATKTKAARK